MKKSPAKRLHPTAYDDTQFMHSPICRGIRLELEYLKPSVTMEAHGIDSTVVVFGSARIKSPTIARQMVKEAKADIAKHPYSAKAKEDLQFANRVLEQSKYYETARQFARLITQHTHINRLVIMTGGGPGIMEAANRGAKDEHGKTVGLSITLPFEEKPNPYVPEELNFHFHYFCIRKMHFAVHTKAIACFPGGFGTLDELFEFITLVQTGIISPIPILLFGKTYWKELINWQMLADEGMISPDDLKLFKFCDSAEKGLKEILDFYGLKK